MNLSWLTIMLGCRQEAINDEAVRNNESYSTSSELRNRSHIMQCTVLNTIIGGRYFSEMICVIIMSTWIAITNPSKNMQRVLCSARFLWQCDFLSLSNDWKEQKDVQKGCLLSSSHSFSQFSNIFFGKLHALHEWFLVIIQWPWVSWEDITYLCTDSYLKQSKLESASNMLHHFSSYMEPIHLPRRSSPNSSQLFAWVYCQQPFLELGTWRNTVIDVRKSNL